jgi:hypothetical protein
VRIPLESRSELDAEGHDPIRTMRHVEQERARAVEDPVGSLAVSWPTSPDELAREQERLASLRVSLWEPPPLGPIRVGACAVVFGRAGRDDRGWAAAVVVEGGAVIASSTHTAAIGPAFEPAGSRCARGPSSRSWS